jgi:uncharacterized membrane protein (UPF0182 family)
MPELRLVVLALQERLAFGPTFDAAMRSIFAGEPSSLSAATAPAEPENAPTPPSAPKPTTDLNALIAAAAKDLADYQRLTAEGKLAEAGRKLEDLKRKLDELQAHQRNR